MKFVRLLNGGKWHYRCILAISALIYLTSPPIRGGSGKDQEIQHKVSFPFNTEKENIYGMDTEKHSL